jgi:YYY domain-containing protein
VIDVLIWWLTCQFFGLAVLPLTVRLFANLPDRGYAFARPLGLLVVGYLFWQGSMFGILPSDRGSVAILLVATGFACWSLLWRDVTAIRDLWTSRRWLIAGTEVVFLGAFALWAFVRAHNPEIAGTEKPMEIAFLNGVLRSERFPPVDPWLSGYSISYYYFGYVIVGMLTMVSGVASSVAFNLALATLFALTATGAWSLGANLAAAARTSERGDDRPGVRRAYLAGGFLSVLLVLFLANLEPVIEILNAHNLLAPEFVRWLNIKDIPPGYNSPTWHPSEPPDTWWWFRATRVIGDPASGLDYTINEFPFFSFLLGDLHPHVLALPFAILALAFSFNLARERLSLADVRRRPLTLAAIAILFGGLGFLNAWDMLTYLFVLAGAFMIQRVLLAGTLNRVVLRETLFFGLGSLAMSVLAYFNFFALFQSQTSGLGVVLVRTQWHHFLLFWGPLYFLAISFLIFCLVSTWRVSAQNKRGWSFQTTTWLITGMVAVVLFILDAPAIAFALVPIVMILAIASRLVSLPDSLNAVEPKQVVRRPAEPVEIAGGSVQATWSREHLFVLLLLGTAMLLILGCELVFIRDFFHNRMNTVFKLYYQAWLLVALGAAFGVQQLGERWLTRHSARLIRFAWTGTAAMVVALALLYPVGATLSKTGYFEGEPTLDGFAFLERYRPDDAMIISWLDGNVSGTPVILEATGGSYRPEFGRVSAATGLPTILGWEGHELQWRGRFEEPSIRKQNIERIYRSPNQTEVASLLAQYEVEYVIVGETERQLYDREPEALAKFDRFLDPVFQTPSGATIYQVRGR